MSCRLLEGGTAGPEQDRPSYPRRGLLVEREAEFIRRDGPHGFRSKIKNITELAALLPSLRGHDKKVVHCHGVFDPLHIGHIRHFEQAKKLGQILVVTVTPDQYVNKGPHRPVFPQELRAEAIAALQCVDFVAVNEWPMAIQTIQALRPDVFVKGSEFRSNTDRTGAIPLEQAAVTSVGGRLEFTDDIVFSASTLVNRHLAVFPEEFRAYLSNFAASPGAPAPIQ